ncbi:hypothetical protein AAMO2058_000005800 [Amorphochlora amoebiformis]|uniref:RanBD1 domain-containing protein n=1 Tax=Amorphochlora amoebiformis TaxID=1561963 RepID=A0A7S0DCE9_9EUKA|mmetsp:Transcript_23758/g.37351  ORF Transcript_23758/g.37351 Transcript_23758/m.37351 type:complete len:365 (+) Transcript_23758:67-1161(+)
MSKRRNERQITKDDVEDDTGGGEVKSWNDNSVASKEKLAQRKILKVRRKTKGSDPVQEKKKEISPPKADSSAPVFSFGSSEPVSVSLKIGKKPKETASKSTGPVFSFSKPAESTTGEKEKGGKAEAGEKKDEGSFNYSFTSDDTGGFSLDTGFKAETSAPIFGGFDSSAASDFTFDHTFKTEGSLNFATAAKDGSLESDSKKDSGNPLAQSEQSSFTFPSSKSEADDKFDESQAASKGDENDEVLFKRKSKVFELDGKGVSRSWKERGKGELHINAYTNSGKKKGRIILRNESTKTLVLNCPIHNSMEQKPHPDRDRFIQFLSVNIKAGDPKENEKVRPFLLGFKTKTDAQQALAKIAEVLTWS